MTLKTLLLNLKNDVHAKRLLDVVLPLASAFEAHLTALHVEAPYTLGLAQVLTADLESISRDERRMRNEIEALRHLVHERCAPEPIVVEWRHIAAKDDPSVAAAVVAEGRSADLIVASFSEPDEPAAYRAIPSRVALESGRPVLLIPASWTRAFDPKTIVVAWNGSREAARAAYDALPLLKRASRVEIVSPSSADGEVTPLSGEEIAKSLARHGIKCDVTAFHAAAGKEGERLAEHAAETGADLLVMGAYGRSRFAELVLGGATRQVLAGSPIPVLMSH